MKIFIILLAFTMLNLSNKVANSDDHMEVVWETEKDF